jgi:pimeloyl-ACP methyl ester carboxylesterase
VYPVDPPYVQQVAALNIIEPWTRLNVPVLVLYGESDFVTEEADHVRIAQVVNAAHPQRATLRNIDGMDHLLFRAATPKAAMDAFEKGAPREYDSDFSRAIITWLKSYDPNHSHHALILMPEHVAVIDEFSARHVAEVQ